jgi:elongation factor G
VRVIGLFAHVDAGKTTTSEGLLYHTGRIHRMGRVDQGNTQLDWMEQERQRGITITSAATTFAWKAHRINLIDTPGHVDFSAEVVRSMRVIDGAVIVLCGVGGVEPQTETAWRYADQEGLPRLVFVNKLDREGAAFAPVMAEIQARLTASAVALQIPLGSERGFAGVVDLLERRALIWSAGAPEPAVEAVPPRLDAQVAAARETLVEAICATDEALLTQWLEGCEPERAALQAALRRAAITGELVPVVCGSALHDIGLQPLLGAIVDYLPSPFEKPGSPVIDRENGPDAPLCAAVFKIVTDPYLGHLTWVRVLAGHLQTGERVRNSRTGIQERVGRIFRMHADKREQLDRMTAGDVVALGGTRSAITGDTLCDPEYPVELERLAFPEPVIGVALAPRDDGELDRLHRAVVRLAEEDPTLIAGHDPQTGEDTLSGMGELHLEVAVDRLRTEFGVVPQVSEPQIAYRETVQRRAESTATYRRQSGGHGHYAQVQLRVEPLARGREVAFANVALAPGGPSDRGRGHRPGVPAEYVRHVELGVREALEKGVFAGYPGTDLQVTLLDGRFHSVDTCGMDFRIAGSMAARQAVRRACPALLEPVMRLDIDVDEERFGAVAADLGRRRGRIRQVDTRGGGQHLTAEVPLSAMRGYASDLRSLTQGRCTFVLEFQQYDLVPEEETRAIVAQRRLEGKIPDR